MFLTRLNSYLGLIDRVKIDMEMIQCRDYDVAGSQSWFSR